MPLAQLFKEDNGQWSANRSWGYAIVALVVTEIGVQNKPLTWLHVALIGIAFIAKVLQKMFEVKKPTLSEEKIQTMQAVAEQIVKEVRSEG